jgi:hypothetical protein
VDVLGLPSRVKVDDPSDDPGRIWPSDPAEASLEPGDGLPGCPQAFAQKAKPVYFGQL